MHIYIYIYICTCDVCIVIIFHRPEIQPPSSISGILPDADELDLESSPWELVGQAVGFPPATVVENNMFNVQKGKHRANSGSYVEIL